MKSVDNIRGALKKLVSQLFAARGDGTEWSRRWIAHEEELITEVAALPPQEHYTVKAKIRNITNGEIRIPQPESLSRCTTGHNTELYKGQDQKSGTTVTNTIFSPQIAADLKAKRVRAFIPVSAAGLIWREALLMGDRE